MPATCSESTAASAAGGGGGGVKIYACLLCHPENAGITAFRCERKHGGWWCWGWRGVCLVCALQIIQMIYPNKGILKFGHVQYVAVGAGQECLD